MRDAPELKPCPFCGKMPKRVYLCGHQKIGTGPWSELWVTDHTCAPGHGDSPSSAARNWNRRADLVPAPGWQSIETAPRDTKNGILGYYDAIPGVFHIAWYEGQWVSFDGEITNFHQPSMTHWMPLPEPPSEGVEP